MESLFVPNVFAQYGAGVFFAILFLQSGLDKVFNWTSNRDWIKSHFSKSLLSRFATPMFIMLTLAEVLAGILCAAGVIYLAFNGFNDLLIFGLEASAISLLMLFFGQRLAQDYAGAQSIAIYFGVLLIALLFFI
ncbi:MAG: DoxX family membrane protein [Saprospiraceae bacterium]|nr:DoxX family membrane protein [Saprospiraceae bacterium]